MLEELLKELKKNEIEIADLKVQNELLKRDKKSLLLQIDRLEEKLDILSKVNEDLKSKLAQELKSKEVKDITLLQLDLVKWWCGYAHYQLLVIHPHFDCVRLSLKDLQEDEIKYFTLKEVLDEIETHLDHCIGTYCYCGDEQYDDFIHNKRKQVARAIEELE